MNVDVKEKYFWFVYFELLCGFVASIAWDYAYTRADNDNHEAFNVMHGVMLSGGFFPVVFRSMLYTYEKELGKATYMTLMITALCLYILGGVIWLIDKGDIARGIFAIIAGVLLIVDLILKLFNK